jgi:hypothetical protein
MPTAVRRKPAADWPQRVRSEEIRNCCWCGDQSGRMRTSIGKILRFLAKRWSLTLFLNLFLQASKVLHFQSFSDSRHTLDTASTKRPAWKGDWRWCWQFFKCPPLPQSQKPKASPQPSSFRIFKYLTGAFRIPLIDSGGQTRRKPLQFHLRHFWNSTDFSQDLLPA